jgi:hypothetical protein
MSSLALEEAVTETEVCIYAKVGDWSGLDQAVHMEEQVQLDGRFEGGIKCRVRQVGDVYTFTFKTPHEGDLAMIEQNIAVDADFFEAFKQAAKYYVKKRRYIFKSTSVTTQIMVDDIEQSITLPEVLYEVDVYYDVDDKPVEWCKIDIEIDSIMDYLSTHIKSVDRYTMTAKISHLPFHPLGGILSSSVQEGDLAFIDRLWRERYQRPISK